MSISSRAAWLIGVPAAIALVIGAASALALHTEKGRRALVSVAATRIRHAIDVRGDLEVRLRSRRLQVVAHEVSIGNPSWMPPGRLGRFSTVKLAWSLSARHLPRLQAVELLDGDLQPRRTAEGASNWSAGGGIPPLQSLRLEGVRVRLHDARGNLDFDGTVQTVPREDGRFHLDARGRLNGRDTQVAITGDALSTVEPGKPWRF